jgi:hypothetical protein
MIRHSTVAFDHFPFASHLRHGKKTISLGKRRKRRRKKKGKGVNEKKMADKLTKKWK